MKLYYAIVLCQGEIKNSITCDIDNKNTKYAFASKGRGFMTLMYSH